MNRVAVISDIHGNLPALNAVVDHIDRQNIETIFNLGDHIGYGPFPNEVVEVIRDSRFLNIIGNYDLKVLAIPDNRKKWVKKKHPLKFFSFDWTFKRLSESSKSFLNSLSESVEVEKFGKSFLLCHGSPDSVDEHLTPETPVERFEQLGEEHNEEIILFGHTHIQFFKIINDKIFLDPGSVGRPEGTKGLACYGCINIFENGIVPELHQVEYDIDTLLEKLEKEKIPPEFSQVFIQGKKMDDILNN